MNNCSSKFYPKGTIFVTARGTVGSVAIAGVEMSMNQSCYAISTNDSCECFTHQLTLHTISKLKSEAVGAVFNALVTKDFDGQLIVSPEKKITNKFNTKIQKIYDLILSSENEILLNRTLVDLLLSKMAKA